MYSIKIESLNKDNGNPYASVSFTRDTGESELYRELVTFVDEETNETKNRYDEKTRPRLEVVHCNFYFSSQADLDRQILAKKSQLESLQTAVSGIEVGEYTPTETPVEESVPQDGTVEVALTPEQVFTVTVNRLKNALAMSAVGALQGVAPTEENAQYISQGLQFVQQQVTEHPEYLDLIDLSALLPLLKP